MRHFVEFFDWRRFFTETYVHEITERDPAVQAADMPAEYFGFRFFDMADAVEAPPSLDGVEFKPLYKRQNESGMYFPDGVLYNQRQIGVMANQNPDRWSVLYSNMTGNDVSHVLVTRTGNTTTFDPDRDKLL